MPVFETEVRLGTRLRGATVPLDPLFASEDEAAWVFRRPVPCAQLGAMVHVGVSLEHVGRILGGDDANEYYATAWAACPTHLARTEAADALSRGLSLYRRRNAHTVPVDDRELVLLAGMVSWGEVALLWQGYGTGRIGPLRTALEEAVQARYRLPEYLDRRQTRAVGVTGWMALRPEPAILPPDHDPWAMARDALDERLRRRTI